LVSDRVGKCSRARASAPQTREIDPVRLKNPLVGHVSMAVFGGRRALRVPGGRRAYLTMNALSLSIWSRETSRRAVEGTPSSSICGRGAGRRGGRCQKRRGSVPLVAEIAEDARKKRVRGSGVRAGWGPRGTVRGFEGGGRTSRRVFFSATSLPVLLSLALYTLP
jgi:hypothetical protein